MLPLTPRLIVEPDHGLEPVREFIDSAQTSLLVKQFTFTEPSLVAAVIDRKKAGVDVRVQLNAARYGGDRANDETYEQFQSAGVAVQWSNPKFYVTHEKSIVVDEKAALVATFNLMESTSRLPLTTASSPTTPTTSRRSSKDSTPTGSIAIGTAATMKACCGAIPIRAITWRNSSTRRRNGWMSSIPNTSMRSFSNGSRRQLIAVSKCTFSAVESTASVSGTFSTPSRRFGH